MTASMYLIDKSALTRMGAAAAVRDVIAPLIIKRRAATCAIVNLEMLYSAQSPDHYEQLEATLVHLRHLAMSEAIMQRAIEIQSLLAAKSQHRGVSLPDLMVAACAERHDATVLHYDGDYDRIASITGQPVQWVVPSGTVA
jgi:predicted nucleic acid-binding protein